MRSTLTILAVSLFVMFPRHTAASLLGQATTPAGGAFANACAGYDSQLGGAGNAGQAYVSTATLQCNFFSTPPGSAFTVIQSASAAGSYQGSPYSGDASASALPGSLRFGASGSGSSATPFPGGATDAGYNDHITVNSNNGQTGDAIWVVPFLLHGTMNTNTGGYGILSIDVYKNSFIVNSGNSSNGAGSAYSWFLGNNVTKYGDVLSSTTNEELDARVDGTIPSLTFNTIVDFAIPVTLGTAFDFGIWEKTSASQQSNGPGGPANQTDIDFTHSLTYVGGSFIVLPNGSTESNLRFASASGLDYAAAVGAVPEPATTMLALPGLAMLIWLMKRRSPVDPAPTAPTGI